MKTVLDAVADRLIAGDELLIRIPEICEATGVNYGSVYHHFGSREGVIDAAYNEIFSRLFAEDLAVFAREWMTRKTIDDYTTNMMPLVTILQTGPERVTRRSLRLRIVAAAATRPELRTLIGETQRQLTEEWRKLVENAQSRGWIRSDVSATFFAAFFQIMVFGRALDDISNTPLVTKTGRSPLVPSSSVCLDRRAFRPKYPFLNC